MNSDITQVRATVVDYLNALEKGDLVGFQKFTPSGYSHVREDIEERLSKYGGVNAATAEISISLDISPKVFVVKIRAQSKDERELAWTENIFRHDGKWCLVIGGYSNKQPSSNIDHL